MSTPLERTQVFAIGGVLPLAEEDNIEEAIETPDFLAVVIEEGEVSRWQKVRKPRLLERA